MGADCVCCTQRRDARDPCTVTSIQRCGIVHAAISRSSTGARGLTLPPCAFTAMAISPPIVMSIQPRRHSSAPVLSLTRASGSALSKTSFIGRQLEVSFQTKPVLQSLCYIYNEIRAIHIKH